MGLQIAVRSAWYREPEREISFQFDQTRIVIGRGAGVDVRLPNRTVSANHATIELKGTEYQIVDSGSTNGTKVNGIPLTPERPKTLRDGDLVEVGVYLLSIRAGLVVTEPVSAERTSEMARRLVREIIAPRSREMGQPRLVVLNGPKAGEQIEIPDPPSRLLVGRGESCQLVLPDADVSRTHLEVIRDLDGARVRNLDSTNGVFVAGQRVNERRLRNGIEIVLGNTRLVFEDPAEEFIRSMDGEPDLPALPEDPDTAGAGESETDSDRSRETAPADPSLLSPRPVQGARSPVPAGAELLIYLLAAAIVVLSIGGLVILLRAG